MSTDTSIATADWFNWSAHIWSILFDEQQLATKLCAKLDEVRAAGYFTMFYGTTQANAFMTVMCNHCQNSCTWSYGRHYKRGNPVKYLKEKNEMIDFLNLRDIGYDEEAESV